MNGKVKYAICKGCENKKAIYCRGKCEYCYWKETNRNAQLKRDSRATGNHREKKKTNFIPQRSKQGKINHFSKKMLAKLAVYRPLRDKFMKENPICQFKECNRLANDLHHKKRRGKNLCNVETFMSVCRPHHDWIEENPWESKELGYLI